MLPQNLIINIIIMETVLFIIVVLLIGWSGYMLVTACKTFFEANAMLQAKHLFHEDRTIVIKKLKTLGELQRSCFCLSLLFFILGLSTSYSMWHLAAIVYVGVGSYIVNRCYVLNQKIKF